MNRDGDGNQSNLAVANLGRLSRRRVFFDYYWYDVLKSHNRNQSIAANRYILINNAHNNLSFNNWVEFCNCDQNSVTVIKIGNLLPFEHKAHTLQYQLVTKPGGIFIFLKYIQYVLQSSIP